MSKKAGCTPEKTSDALSEAASLCKKRGGMLTPLRQKALTLLLEAPGPIKAYDMLQHLRDGEAAKPATAYRALDFLVEMGLAHKIESLQAFAPCRHWTHGHSAAFLICDLCGGVDELDADDSLAKLTQESARVSFKARTAVIEVSGVCARCA